MDKVITHPKQVYTFIGVITSTLSIIPYSYYSIENNKLKDNEKQIQDNEKQRQDNEKQRKDNEKQREDNEKQRQFQREENTLHRNHEIKKYRWFLL